MINNSTISRNFKTNNYHKIIKILIKRIHIMMENTITTVISKINNLKIFRIKIINTTIKNPNYKFRVNSLIMIISNKIFTIKMIISNKIINKKYIFKIKIDKISKNKNKTNMIIL